MIEWIDVKEKLPDILTPVLIYIPSQAKYSLKNIPIFIASFCNLTDTCNDWHILPQSFEPYTESMENITHWSYLPNIPLKNM